MLPLDNMTYGNGDVTGDVMLPDRTGGPHGYSLGDSGKADAINGGTHSPDSFVPGSVDSPQERANDSIYDDVVLPSHIGQ